MNPIFKELGVKEWELQHPEFKKFYQWLGNNITAENILAEEELESYDAIPPDERLEGAALQYEMDRIEKKYPGIMNVTPELVARKTEEVAQLAKTQAVYEKIANDLQYKKHDQQIENDIFEATIAVRMEEESLKKLEQQCNERLEEIEKIEKLNIDMTIEMAKLMQNYSGTEATFVHQLDLEEYYKRIEIFEQFVDKFMRSNFKTEENSNIEEENKRDTEKLEMVKETLWMSWKQNIEAECKLYGQQCVVSRLKQHIKPMSMVTIAEQLAELQELNRELEVKKELQWIDLEFALRKEIDLTIDLTIQEYTQGKVDRARNRVERFKRANSLLSEQLALADILWIMVNTDIDRIERFAKMFVLEQYESEAVACSKRIDLMRKTTFDEATDTFWHKFQAAVGSPNGDCVDHFFKMFRKIQAICKQLKFQCYADEIDAVIENIGSICDMLQKLLFDGVLSRPAYKDQLLMSKSHISKAQLSSFTAELNKFRTRYVSEYVKPMNQDKFFNAKQNLWIWFLTQPQDVLKVLSSLKAAAAKSKKPEPKPIAGISRRK